MSGMYRAYWITFKGRGSACVEAAGVEAAKAVAAKLTDAEVVDAKLLPYPAEPRLNKHQHEFTDGRKRVCPSFCYSPRECAGRSSCPQRYACSE